MEKTLLYIIIADVILGGAGRYIAFGPVSIRMIIFIIGCLFMVRQVIKNRGIKNNFNYVLYGLLLVDFVISLLIGINNNEFSFAVGKFLSYSMIVLLPFFIENIDTKEFAEDLFRFFMKLVYCVSGLSIFVYVLMLPANETLSGNLNSILNNLHLGALAYVSEHLPRVFLKCSIFILFALVFKIHFALNDVKGIKRKDIVGILFLGFALFTSMTMAFWGAFAVMLVCSLVFTNYKSIFEYLKGIKKYKLAMIPLALLVVVVILFKLNIPQVVALRFNADDISVQTKAVQSQVMFDNIKESPLFGHGFGKVLDIKTDFFERKSDTWEIMWLEFILTNGIIGLLIYGSLIGYNLWLCRKAMLKSTSSYQKSMLVAIFTSMIGLIVINFSNPFLNNPIGIGYLLLCIGILVPFTASNPTKKAMLTF